jgi:N-acyl-D-aspartate/D-glutamate deacylase
VLSEGSKRGMSYNHMAELVSWKPAQRFGLLSKGDIAPGYDTDIAIVDPHESFVVHAAESSTASLFHRDRFREIARLVHVGAEGGRGVIGDQLHRNGIDQRRYRRGHVRQDDDLR